MSKTKRIIVVCGGGMLGLPAAAALDELRRLTAPGSLSSSIDLFVGTSIGGIVTAIAAAELPGPITNFFVQDGPEIFESSFWRHWPLYSGNTIESVLKKRLNNMTFGDCKTRLMLTALDRTNQVPFMFKSYDTSNLLLGARTPLWQAARATSAAQRYFPAYLYNQRYLWDGGNIANNPAVCAYAEACAMWPGEPVRMLVLGCGEDLVKVPSWLPQWIQDLMLTISLQFETSQDEVDYQMKKFIGLNYTVLQPVFGEGAAMDHASPEGLAILQSAATNFVRDNRAAFLSFLND